MKDDIQSSQFPYINKKFISTKGRKKFKPSQTLLTSDDRIKAKRIGWPEDGVDGRSKRVVNEDRKRAKRERMSPFYGTDGASIGKRRATTSRGGVRLES